MFELETHSGQRGFGMAGSVLRSALGKRVDEVVLGLCEAGPLGSRCFEESIWMRVI